jgi:polyhydroxyalkanoate synthesis regulator protein
VYDAKSSEDITRNVLTQIIVEEESKGTSMLPTNFLRQLIGFYGDSLQGVVPRYLESAMSNFARQQQQMRQVMQQTFSPFLPMGVEEMGRQNIALMERAMAMFNPFARPGEPSPKPVEPSPMPVPAPPQAPEIDAMRHELEALRAQLAIARAESVMAQNAAVPSPASLPEPVPLPMAAPASVPLADPAPIPLSVARKVRAARKTDR